MVKAKILKEIGFEKDFDRFYHEKLSNYKTFLRKSSDGWYFVGSWENLNKIPIKNKEHLIEFVKNTFGIEL